LYAVFSLRCSPLEKKVVGNRQQGWPEKRPNQAERQDTANKPKQAEHVLVKQIRSKEIVNAADEKQAPDRDEDAPSY
jgi:hypothetical protein